jgi:nucleotide-binding universal stress UspA family protein
MFNYILLPTDGSATSQRSAAEAAELIQPGSGTRVTLLLVVGALKSEDTDFDEEIVQRHNAAMYRKAEGVLERASRIFAIRGIPCETKIVEGDPVSAAIAAEAASGGYDVIVMGSRGLSMHKSDMHYLGSVTEHVIRRVDLPVVVVPVHKLPKGRDEE